MDKSFDNFRAWCSHRPILSEQQGPGEDRLAGVHDWQVVVCVLGAGGAGGRGPGPPPQELLQHQTGHLQAQDANLVLQNGYLLIFGGFNHFSNHF